MWFEELVGFKETSPQEVWNRLSVRDGRLCVNGSDKSWAIGDLKLESVKRLRTTLELHTDPSVPVIRIKERVCDVQELLLDKENAGATFQVAISNGKFQGII